MFEKISQPSNRLIPILLSALFPSFFIFLLYRLAARGLATGDFQAVGSRAGAVLLSGHIWVQLILALTLLLYDFVSDRVARRFPTQWGPRIRALLAGIPSRVIFYAVGQSLAKGAWVSQQPFAAFIGPAAGFAGAILFSATAYVAYRFGPALRKKRRTAGVLCGVPTAAAALFAVADLISFPLIYPNFHIFLFFMSSLSAAVMGREVSRIIHLRIPKMFFTPLFAVSAASVLFALFLLVRIDRGTRAELAQTSRVAEAILSRVTVSSSKANLIDLLRTLPKTDFNKEGSDLPRGQIKTEKNWNVVLIVVDTMRVDVLLPEYAPNWNQLKEEDIPFLSEWMKDTYRFPYVYSDSNTTHASMPSLLRSIRPNEDFLREGEPPAPYMSSLGRSPIAVVVDNIFSTPSHKSVEVLYSGFENVDVYYQNAMYQQNKVILNAIKNAKEGPFFAWIHLYALHRPGFSGKRLLSNKDGTCLETYRMSVRWLDSQLKKLFSQFKKMGIDKNTIVILASDHGEGLGIRGMNTHGKYLYDEEVRVPLVIRIPGYPGAVIDKTVGNIDIMPTVADLLGADRSNRHRGKSLVPLMADPDTAWNETYYLQDADNEYAAVVSGREKLIYQPKTDLFFRHDLEKDPFEKRNLFGIDPIRDADWIQRLVLYNQGLFEEGLNEKEVTSLLEHRLKEITDKTSKGQLRLLLGLASRSKSEKIVNLTRRLFKKAAADTVRLAILDNMFAKDKRGFGRLLKKYIEGSLGKPDELQLIRQLADQGQPRFSEAFVAKRMQWWAGNADISEIDPWLSLIKNWQKISAQYFAAPLAHILTELKLGSPSPKTDRLLEAALSNVAFLIALENEDRNRLSDEIAPLLEHRSVAVRIAACKALANLKFAGSLNAALSKLQDVEQDMRVRKAAMKVVVSIEKENAVPMLLEYGREEPFLMDVIRYLTNLRSKEALPFLKNLKKNHFNGRVHRAARRAISQIEKK